MLTTVLPFVKLTNTYPEFATARSVIVAPAGYVPPPVTVPPAVLETLAVTTSAFTVTSFCVEKVSPLALFTVAFKLNYRSTGDRAVETGRSE